MIKNFILYFFILLGLNILTFAENINYENHQSLDDTHDFPHAFLLPMGIPNKPGTYNVQLSPFIQRKNGDTKGDIGGHFSVGMFDWGGVHLRSLGVSTTPTTEIITMVALKRSESGKEGISFLGIIGIPTNLVIKLQSVKIQNFRTRYFCNLNLENTKGLRRNNLDNSHLSFYQISALQMPVHS